MTTVLTVSVTSELDDSCEAVWAGLGTMAGVNRELAPWIRMTVPAAATGLRLEDAPIGQLAFHSWLLLFGAIPFDRHALMLRSIEPGRGFVEDSTSWLQRRWEHRRRVEARDGASCILTDRVHVVPRVGWASPAVRRIVTGLFRHRHRVLQRTHGGRFRAG